MYKPTLKTIQQLSNRGNIAPIYKEISAANETPTSIYSKIANQPYSFLLESATTNKTSGRFSFIGTEPIKIIMDQDKKQNPLVEIQNTLKNYQLIDIENTQRFSGGFVGYLSYDAINNFEKIPEHQNNPLKIPEYIFMLCTTFVSFDHKLKIIRITSLVDLKENIEKSYSQACKKIDEIISKINNTKIQNPNEKNSKSSNKNTIPEKPSSNMSKKEYFSMVDKAKKYIYDGEIIQAVISQRFSKKISVDPLKIYESLKKINPSPYMYFLDLEDFHIVGSSPEMLVRLENGEISTNPIAGTSPRGKTKIEDDSIAQELQSDEKEVAEHTMLLDLGRNDLGRVSVPGTVKVSKLMQVDRYSHVMHLVSEVKGQLVEGLNSSDVLKACFPAGTVSGAPKIRAMEIISELEKDKRGPYAGAVGYFDFQGNMDTAISIRTLVIKDEIAHVQAGGGIVHDSIPEKEYMETIHKSSAVIKAIEETEKQSYQKESKNDIDNR